MAVVLTAVMLLTAAPLSGFVGLDIDFGWLDFSSKASALDSSGSCGDNVTYTFDSKTGLLTISGTGDMQNYYSASSPFYNNSSIKSVVINNGVTSIGYGAFGFCESLIRVKISDSVTRICSDAFFGCIGLISIEIPDRVTSIGEHSFYGCTGLTSINVDVNNAVYDSRNNCNAIIETETNTLIKGCKNTTIPDGVTSIGDWAFYGCISLPSITIPDSVTSIGGSAFESCTGLTSVTIPDSVTSIGGSAFESCTGLTSVTIGNSVTSIGDWAFYGCIGLTSITIPNSVTSIRYYTFGDCTGLTSVIIGNSVTSIGDAAFEGCISLPSITIPDSVTSIGGSAFESCTGLTSVTIGNSVTSIGSSAFRSCTGLTSLTIPNSVTSIGYDAFFGCTGLTNIIIPDSVTIIYSDAFSGCYSVYLLIYKDSYAEQYAVDNSLKYLIISKISDDTEAVSGKVTNSFLWSIDTATGTLTIDCKGTMVSFKDDFAPWIQYQEYIKHIVISGGCTSIGKNAFILCNKVESVSIPDSVKNIDSSAFYCCSELASITIPDSVTSIGDSAFRYCSGLTSITIPDSVTSIGNSVFYGCAGLTSIIIPDGITSIGYDAFYGCTGLTSIIIPDGVTSIGYGAFSDCTGLTSISIPDSVTSFGSNVLSGCTKLTTLYIGSSNIYSSEFKNYTSLKNVTIDTGVTTIGDYAFNGCTGLEEMVIPYSVKSIGTAAFTGCTNLGSLTVYSRNCTFADDATAYYTTICGFTGSTAETYANEKGFDFVAIDDTHTHVYDDANDKTCNLCGADRTVCEHPSTHIEHKDSTCTEHGYDKSICDICGATVSTTELPYKHDYVATITDPTCTEQGYTTYTCSLCGDSYISDYTEPLNHPHKTWRVTKNPTADSTGLMTETCDLCGAKTGEMEIPMLIPNFVTGITVSPNRLALNVGETANLTAIITPDTAENKNVIWSSSDTDIATVADGVVTAKTPGVAMIIVQSEDGGYKDFCVVRVASLTPANGAVVDNENGLIYGIASNSADINSYVNTVDDTMTVECDSALLGTGSVVNIVKDDVIVDSYKIVLFGDVNGDGWYDGMDAVTVSCIANGMLTKDQIGEAAYMAADCNHDGVVDEFDVALLNQAGVLLANVDQTKTQEELAADSDYAEYLNLIDQNPTVEEEPKKPEQDNGFIAKLIAFIETILKYIVTLVNKIW